jgi:hypothetical protein
MTGAPDHAEILGLLRALGSLPANVWLAGGVGLDFLVGRWTRAHADVDLVAAEVDRALLTEALKRLGFVQTHTFGWHTRWTRCGRDVGEVELDFFRREPDGRPVLVVEPDDALGFRAGRYPSLPNALDPTRFARLEDVDFRVVSAEEQWVVRQSYPHLRPGDEAQDARVQHDLRLLEQLLSERERRKLDRYVALRIRATPMRESAIP